MKNQVSRSELKKISYLTNPDDHLAIFKIPNEKPINKNKLLVGLESINDPGNLGTIIRTCEWFGVKDIVCSLDSVDCYNPKVVQSAMGSLSRINITYLDLKNFLTSESLNKFGTFINGQSVFENKISTDTGIVVFGNEANGISENLRSLIDIELTIPRFNNERFPESLNLSNSLGIILSEFSRKSSEMKNFIKIPLENNFSILLVKSPDDVGLSGINSFVSEKTPLIDGENLKY